jgi:ADP-heptose:LPS heptosyltransferase
MRRSLLLSADAVVARTLFPLFVLLAKLRRGPRFKDPVQLRKAPRFLVIRPGGLGDGIMAVPLLRALRRRFPAAYITLVCVSKNRKALEHLAYVDELMVVDVMRDLPRHLLRLLRGRYEVVLDLEPFRYLSAIIGFLSNAGVRIGFDTNRRRALYTHLTTYVHDRCSESQNMIRQLGVLGVQLSDEECADLSFDLPEWCLTAAREMLLTHGVEPSHDFLVAVAPGVLKPHHRWVMSEFAALIEAIHQEDAAARVVLVGEAADVADAEEVLACLSDRRRVVDLVGRTSFMEALGVLRSCRMLIACDGGIVYMGAAMGCATVSLWGPGVMERFKPSGARHVGVRKGFSCIPCVTWERLGKFPGCPYQRRCYNKLTAGEVFEPYVRLKRTLTARPSLCGRAAAMADEASSLQR